VSLNFIILRHVGVISRKKRRLQKSYNIDSIGPPCSKTHMSSAKLVKIVKSQDLFQNIRKLDGKPSGNVHCAFHNL
jgi:hypothetical protein